MGKQSKAPPAPDYTSVANASVEAARIAQEISREQLDWARQTYNELQPTVQAYMDEQTRSSRELTDNAEADRARYEQIFQPVEDEFVRTAMEWDTPERRQAAAGRAIADVNANFDAQREQALSTLDGYGVDPSSTRFQALDLGMRVQQAAAGAAAGTSAVNQVEAQKLALMGSAIDIGKGYPGQVAQSYATGASVGGAGVGAGQNAFAVGGQQMGTGAQWGGLAQQGYGVGGNILNSGYANELNRTRVNNAAIQGNWNMVGQAVGMALPMTKFFGG